MTGLPSLLHLYTISFCAAGTAQVGISTPKSPTTEGGGREGGREGGALTHTEVWLRGGGGGKALTAGDHDGIGGGDDFVDALEGAGTLHLGHHLHLLVAVLSQAPPHLRTHTTAPHVKGLGGGGRR